MIPAIADRRSHISDLCRRYHVRRLDLFGSAARGVDFTDESDIDLLVEYDSDFSPPPLSEFFQFRRDLSSLLSRQIDLTMAGAVRNPYVREAIERSRQMLHGA